MKKPSPPYDPEQREKEQIEAKCDRQIEKNEQLLVSEQDKFYSLQKASMRLPICPVEIFRFESTGGKTVDEQRISEHLKRAYQEAGWKVIEDGYGLHVQIVANPKP